jgi:hypothetical protein
MSSIRATVQRDRAAERKLRQALEELPIKFRNKPIIKAQKQAMRPAKQAALRILNAGLNTTSLSGHTLSITEGRHSKKLRPYVVLQAQNKAKPARRLRETYSSTTRTNWYKIEHIINRGTDSGPRRAGTSVRIETAGRQRIKVFDENGNPKKIRKATQGRTFVVETGRGVVPIKQIDHPGTEPLDYYDRAYRATADRMKTEFLGFVKEQVKQTKQKHGIR